MTGDVRTIAVVSAGLSEPSSSSRLADLLAGSAVDALDLRGARAEVRTIEVKDLVHDIATSTLTRYAPPALESALVAVGRADAVIAVSPIFNASFSGLFKSFVDLLEPGSLRGRPVLLGATGGSERHSLALDHALRPLFSYLGALVLPTGVFAVSDEVRGVLPTALRDRAVRAGAELAGALSTRPAVRTELDLEALLIAAD